MASSIASTQHFNRRNQTKLTDFGADQSKKSSLLAIYGSPMAGLSIRNSYSARASSSIGKSNAKRASYRANQAAQETQQSERADLETQRLVIKQQASLTSLKPRPNLKVPKVATAASLQSYRIKANRADFKLQTPAKRPGQS